MRIKTVFDKFAFLVTVPRCVSCDTALIFGEKAFCPKCYAEFQEIKMRNCSRCTRILSQCSCSNEYFKSHYVKKIIKVFRYQHKNENSSLNSLLYSLKKDNRSDVLELSSDELEAAIKYSINNPSEYIFTNVPRRKAAIVKFGIDHAALLAKSLAKRFGSDYISILYSSSKIEQKKLSGEERLKNVKFNIRRNIDLTGKKVIIVDDVITTGSSMCTAAALIRSLGAKEVVAVSIAVAYKDS